MTQLVFSFFFLFYFFAVRGNIPTGASFRRSNPFFRLYLINLFPTGLFGKIQCNRLAFLIWILKWNTPSSDPDPPIWIQIPRNPTQNPNASIEIISMIVYVCALREVATILCDNRSRILLLGRRNQPQSRDPYSPPSPGAIHRPGFPHKRRVLRGPSSGDTKRPQSLARLVPRELATSHP
jgi:hypothetical protein